MGGAQCNGGSSPEGFARNPALVLEFYNQRRRQLLGVRPNKAHEALVALENKFEVHIITQNVDDLHERAGSTNVLHLHGELLSVRSTGDPTNILIWKKDLKVGDNCANGHQLRPNIVWFGEMVPAMETAAEITQSADIILVIGTSLQVYPAAGLLDLAPEDSSVYLIDPRPAIHKKAGTKLHVMAKTAAEGVPELVRALLNE